MPDGSVAGRSIVTRRAIVDIVRIAVQGSYGVTGFSDPSLGRRLLRWIGLDRPGIRLTTAGGLRLDLYLTVAGGVPIAEVARQIDSAVRYSLSQYVGADVASLCIHVDGLRYLPNVKEIPQAQEPSETYQPSEPAGGARYEAMDPSSAATTTARRGKTARKRKAT